jgi:hypothetical protein
MLYFPDFGNYSASVVRHFVKAGIRASVSVQPSWRVPRLREEDALQAWFCLAASAFGRQQRNH